MELYEVYVIENLKKSILYIGVTKNGYNRYRQHLRALKGNYHRNKKMQSDFNNGDNFGFKIIDICIGEHEASELEMFYIKEYKESEIVLYNLNIGGINKNIGYKQSEYAKKVASKTHSKKVGSLNSFYGKKHTKESKEKMSKSLKGKRKGIKFSESHKQNLKISNPNSKKVVIDDIEYISMTDAERQTGINRKKIAKLAKNPDIKNIYHK